MGAVGTSPGGDAAQLDRRQCVRASWRLAFFSLLQGGSCSQGSRVLGVGEAGQGGGGAGAEAGGASPGGEPLFACSLEGPCEEAIHRAARACFSLSHVRLPLPGKEFKTPSWGPRSGRGGPAGALAGGIPGREGRGQNPHTLFDRSRESLTFWGQFVSPAEPQLPVAPAHG